ncbi:MAG TPA: squalene/phytoene synthase family protein [Bacteroidales bacterium]|nr:squalene/phytoene synthase family protein [Bacteroidales bacterium]
MTVEPYSFKALFNKIDFEKIQEHPNILIAASFWDEERYCAAKTCYKFMRAIDDLIDDYKAANREIPESEKERLMGDVNYWIGIIKNMNPCNPMQEELTETLDKFRIPIWPLQNFAKSMVYDIHHDGFQSLQAFLEYAEGASVAPAAIFVHICGVNGNNGQYNVPEFDVAEAARPCALFSYLVHIIRDFQKDQRNNLNYFADNLIQQYGLTRKALEEFAMNGDVDDRFRALVKEYYILADKYRQETYDIIKKIKPYVEPRYQLSLEIIFNLYLMVYERIDLSKGRFTKEELNPSPNEVKERVYQAILKFGQDQ